MLKFFLYLFRWQLSTPVMAPVIIFSSVWLANIAFGNIVALMLANLVGGIVFFFVDRLIFTSKTLQLWEFTEGECYDCGAKGRVRRLFFAGNYDRRNDAKPQYRCELCSEKKKQELIKRGVNVL
jgi:hypothetical protein